MSHRWSKKVWEIQEKRPQERTYSGSSGKRRTHRGRRYGHRAVTQCHVSSGVGEWAQHPGPYFRKDADELYSHPSER